jgi:alpha-amylase/alpha-mannosidase (GH57 family)
MIDCYPRYAELRAKSRLPSGVPRDLPENDIRDLIVWFNLVWFGYSARRDFPLVSELIGQGRGFSEEQKNQLLDLQLEIMAQILPLYRAAAERKQIELTATPFYHPILPLLCSTDAAKPGLPGREIPQPPFAAADDAREHVRRAVALHERVFGSKPKGMWPAEGSVSDEALRIFSEAGIEWVATDQDILFRSDASIKSSGLCTSYRVGDKGSQISMLFRERSIADAIGFRYASMAPEAAINDFMNSLRIVWSEQQNSRYEPLLTIILDGENAWEYYPDGGEAFLIGIYRAVAKSKDFRWTTISDFLSEHPPKRTLKRIFPGSWIGGNFDIWIGSDEENSAWSALREARNALIAGQTRLSDTIACDAWEHIFIAEGSDWFWWYGDDFTTALQGEFDRLFRAHLAEVYDLLDEPVPTWLLKPIRKGKVQEGEKPSALISPKIDGRTTSFYEWVGAGRYDALSGDAAMARSEQFVEAVYYGFDRENWYLRIDTSSPPISANANGTSFVCRFPGRAGVDLTIGPLIEGVSEVSVSLREGDTLVPVPQAARVGTIVECSIPFILLGTPPGTTCEFLVSVEVNGEEIERWPRDGILSFDVPTDTFELDHWTV